MPFFSYTFVVLSKLSRKTRFSVDDAIFCVRIKRFYSSHVVIIVYHMITPCRIQTNLVNKKKQGETKTNYAVTYDVV